MQIHCKALPGDNGAISAGAKNCLEGSHFGIWLQCNGRARRLMAFRALPKI
jgi:hypothetical protein